MSRSIWFATAGSGGGGGRVFDHVVEKVPQRHQVIVGCYNAGSHHTFLNNLTVLDNRGGFVADMGEDHRRETVRGDGNAESSVTKNLRDIVWIGYMRLLGRVH